MPKIHHSAICVRDIEPSLRFWRDGLGFEVTMDSSFDGDWDSLFGGGGQRLRSVFLGDPTDPSGGIVELVQFATGVADGSTSTAPGEGFFLLSVNADVDAVLARLDGLGLGGTPRRIEAYGVAMVTVMEPSGVLVELIDLGDTAAGR